MLPIRPLADITALKVLLILYLIGLYSTSRPMVYDVYLKLLLECE